jgi:hypothetical protein
MKYESYDSQERQNDILDKISKYGIESLTPLEKNFLDSYSINKQDEVHDDIRSKEEGKIFEDDYGYFRFEHQETEDFGNEIHYIGTLYVPDLEISRDRVIEGRLEGKIIVYDNGQTSLDFYSVSEKLSDVYDIFEFCYGIEYELDNFIDYVVSKLEEKNRDF